MEEDLKEDNILYECLEYAEWSQEPEILQSKLPYNNVPLGKSPFGLLKNLTGSTQFPEYLFPLQNNNIKWNFALDPSGRTAAILQFQHIELRSSKDEFSTVIGRIKIDKDPNPQWSVMNWSFDGLFLAYSSSNGDVKIIEVSTCKAFSLFTENTSSNQSTVSKNSTSSVSSLIFIPRRNSSLSDKIYELLIVFHDGTLNSFEVGSNGLHQSKHSFSFAKYYPQGIAMVSYHRNHQILLVSGNLNISCTEGFENASNKNPMSCGLTLWRLLNDAPYYKLATSLSEDILLAKKSWNIPYFSFRKLNHYVVTKATISPNGRSVVALHFDGALSLWDFPSLKFKKFWPLIEQPAYEEVNPTRPSNIELKALVLNNSSSDQVKNFPIGIEWWSDQAIVVSYVTGAISILSIKSLNNLLGSSSEWLEPMPLISSAQNGSLLALECETQIQRKRRLISEESNCDSNTYNDSSDEDDDDDRRILKEYKESISKFLYYITDSDRFQPPRKKPKIMTKIYRLLCIKSTTPEELFTYKLDCEEYGAALTLAQTYGLDCDLVYQRQWRKRVVCVSSIQDYLSKITKRSWVLHECLERVPENIDAARELLLYGLRGTDLPALLAIGKNEDKGKFVPCDRHTLYEEDVVDPSVYVSPEDLQQRKNEKENEVLKSLLKEVNFDSLTLEQKQMLHCRSKLLKYLDFLSTYEYILGGACVAEERFDPKFYSDFRLKSPLRCSIDFARQSNGRAVEDMFTFHGPKTLPYRLTILSNFPETTSPFQYQVLLPECELRNGNCEVFDWPVGKLREPDWIEEEICQFVLNEFCKNDDDNEDNINVSVLDREIVTPKLLSQWYQSRANEIESRSFQVDNALELVKLGLEKNIPNLEQLCDDLVTMEILVYECQIGPDLTLKDYAQLSDVKRIELLMSSTSEDNFLKNFLRWVVPLLQRCQKFSKNSNDLLIDYLVNLSSENLPLSLKIFEAISKNEVLINLFDFEVYVKAAAMCLMSYNRNDFLSVASTLFYCLPMHKLSKNKRNEELQTTMKEIRNCLSVAETLASYEIYMTIKDVSDLKNDSTKIVAVIKKLTRNDAEREISHGDIEWRKVLNDILEMQSKLFNQITKEKCFQIYTEALLCSGFKSNILLAGQLMNLNNTERSSSHPYPLVSYEDSLKLILNAVKEYFNSAAELLDPSMDLAKSCLDLVPKKSVEIQEEVDLILSLNILKDFNVEILPIQVRLCEDRLDLIRAALDSSRTAYQNSQRLLKLAQLLRIRTGDAKKCQGPVLDLIAITALKNKDYDCCCKTCLKIISCGYEPGWTMCEKLGLCEGFEDLGTRCSMISFALCHCPEERIESLLEMQGLLELELLGLSIEESQFHPKSKVIDQESQVDGLASSKMKNVLKSVTSQKLWKNATRRIGFSEDIDVSKSIIPNLDLTTQGVPEFYCSLLNNFNASMIDQDYSSYFLREEHSYLDYLQALLRLSLLDYSLSHGEINYIDDKVLLKLAEYILPNDFATGLALLFTLQKAQDAETYFRKLSKTDISLQLIVYFYALQIYAQFQRGKQILGRVYSIVVRYLVSNVLKVLNSKSLENLEVQVVDLFKHHHDCLADYIQGQMLNNLNFGVDISRFTTDDVYKKETILGLSMTTQTDVYEIGRSLALRYDVSLWMFYCTHLLYLLSETNIKASDIESRIKESDMLDILLSDSKNLKIKLLNDAFPSVDGQNLDRLILLFSLLENCDNEEVLRLKPSNHMKILKKLINVMPEVDYKAMLGGKDSILNVIRKHLNKDNLAAIIKLAPKLPDESGQFLDSSVIHSLWAEKFFFRESSREKSASSFPRSNDFWSQRFNNCKEFIQKMKPMDYLSFINNILFVDRSIDEMTIDCRVDLLKRAIKFVNQQSSKANSELLEKWDEVVDNLRWNITHLGLIQSEPLKSFAQSNDLMLKSYARQFDKSMSREEELKSLMIKTVIDNQPQHLLDDLLSMCNTIGLPWDSSFIFEETVADILNSLGENEEYKRTGLLKSMKLVLTRSTKIFDASSMLIQFAKIEENPIEVKFKLLALLSEFHELKKDEKLLFIVLQTRMHLRKASPNILISIEEISNSDLRRKLFDKLLEETKSLDSLISLCHLLNFWSNLERSADINDDKWLLVMEKILINSDETSLDEAYKLIKHKCQKNMMSEQTFSAVLELMKNCDSSLCFMKICLLSDSSSIQLKAVEKANDLNKIDGNLYDDELFDLIVKRHLIPQLAKSILYEKIIDHLLGGNPTKEDVQKICSGLKENGFEMETGALLLRHKGAPTGLINFNAAFDYFKMWSKNS